MNKSRNPPNNWGFFVDTDPEKCHYCYKKKSSLIFIKESDKLAYYSKKRKYNPYKSVIFIKQADAKIIEPNETKIIEPNDAKIRKRDHASLNIITFNKRFLSIFFAVSTFFTSGVLFLFYNNSIMKSRV